MEAPEPCVQYFEEPYLTFGQVDRLTDRGLAIALNFIGSYPLTRLAKTNGEGAGWHHAPPERLVLSVRGSWNSAVKVHLAAKMVKKVGVVLAIAAFFAVMAVMYSRFGESSGRRSGT